MVSLPMIGRKVGSLPIFCEVSPSLLSFFFFFFGSAEGRPMDKTEWESLLRVTADLTHDFDNVRMKFDDHSRSSEEGESCADSNHQLQQSGGDIESPPNMSVLGEY